MNATNSIALILISGGLLFFVGKPMLADISTVKEERQKYQDDIDKIRKVEDRKNELLTKLNQLPSEEREKIEKFLPNIAGIVRLIADIDGIASKHGISIRSVDSGAVSTDTGRSVADAPSNKYYDSKMITLDFSSKYKTLVEFILDLEESLRMIDVRGIDISQTSSDSVVSDVQNYRVSAEIYWLKEPVDESAAAGAASVPGS